MYTNGSLLCVTCVYQSLFKAASQGSCAAGPAQWPARREKRLQWGKPAATRHSARGRGGGAAAPPPTLRGRGAPATAVPAKFWQHA